MLSYAFRSVSSTGSSFDWSLLRFVLAGILALVGASSPASAVVTFNVDVETESGDGVVRVGDEVTLNIAMTSDGEPYYAIGASVSGYETARARFDRGVAVNSAFNGICIPGPGCFGGIGNMATPLVEDATVPRVRFFLGVSLAPVSATGTGDFGVGGFPIADGDFHATLTFEMLTPGWSRFDVGTQLLDDDVIIAGGVSEQSINYSVDIYVVPEPSAALLIGLGLMGLARRGRND